MKLKVVAAALVVAGAVGAQTQVNVSRQTKDDSSSGASFVFPFLTGATLPAQCTPGSIFFNSGGAAGANLYGCVSANTWALEGGGSGGGSISGLLAVQQSSGTVLTIGGACTILQPCLVHLGSNVYSYTGPSSATLTGGSGAVYVYVDTNGDITVGESASGSPALTCSGCVLAASVTQFPPGTVPLANWSASSGAWLTGNNDVALQSGGPVFVAGSNVSVAQAGDTVTIEAYLESLPSGPQPTCSSTTGGFMWYIPGVTGVKDTVQVCAKDATNTYAWRTLY